MIAKPFCAVILGLCLVLMIPTARLTVLQWQRGDRDAARSLGRYFCLQAAIAVLEVVLLTR